MSGDGLIMDSCDALTSPGGTSPYLGMMSRGEPLASVEADLVEADLTGRDLVQTDLAEAERR
jgi:uncharacterized protein YjbI with pentapeptide repeats